MPYFVRTRRLDIKRLERKPQENLGTIYTILTNFIREIQERLRQRELAFYGKGKTADDEARKWSKDVNSVMQSMKYSIISCADQIDEIIRYANDPDKKFTVELFELNRLKECYYKVRDGIPDRFEDIIADLREVLTQLKKYCLSFQENFQDGVVLETVSSYEKQREEYEMNIEENLNNITLLANKFRHGDLFIHDFSSEGREIARRADCINFPFLIIFQEACENIRNACKAAQLWLEADASYPSFLSIDIKDLESKKEASEKCLREYQHQYHKLNARSRGIGSDSETLKNDIEKLESREEDLFFEEELKRHETNDIHVEIERREYRKDDLLKNVSKTSSSSDGHMLLVMKLNEISEELQEFQRQLPKTKRAWNRIKHKLKWITDKKEQLKADLYKLETTQGVMEKIDQLKTEIEIECDVIIDQLEIAKQIYLYKTCPDALEKIFYDQTVEMNSGRLPGQKGDEDPFEITCSIVAKSIESDWPKLYRNLPFHPPRGKKTIDKDVAFFSERLPRKTLPEVAEVTLNRWRRFHTRAKAGDLRKALVKIKRYDIIQEVINTIDPPPEDELVEEIPTYLEAYLIPYLKDVEKFDHLKAQGKFDEELEIGF